MLHAFAHTLASRHQVPATSAEPAPDEAAFLPGEAVVYRAHGIGHVDAIGRRLIGEDTIDIIQVSFPKSSLLLLIPQHSAARSGLRHISTQEIADAAYATIVDRQRTMRTVWAKKSEVILRKINSGRLDHLAEVVRDLRHHAGSTAGSFSERRLFEMAMERFVGEMAAITGQSTSDTIGHVHERLAEADGKNESPEP